MLNLRVIRSYGKSKYLGVAGVFLIEIPDNDEAILGLLPANIRFKPSSSSAFIGRNIRLVLSTINRDCLTIIKNSKSLANGVKCAEMTCFVNNSNRQDKDLMNDIKMLASHRWPSGKLFFKMKSIQNQNKSLIETLLLLGWKYSQVKNGEQFLELQLFSR